MKKTRFHAFEAIGKQFMLECEQEAATTRFFRKGETVAVYSDASQGQLIAYATIRDSRYWKAFGYWQYELVQHRTGAHLSAASFNLRHLSSEETRLLWSTLTTKVPVQPVEHQPVSLLLIEGGAA